MMRDALTSTFILILAFFAFATVLKINSLEARIEKLEHIK